jgi:outer membrane protein TolC
MKSRSAVLGCRVAAFSLALAAAPVAARGQTSTGMTESDGAPPVLRISLAEAIEVAVLRNYALNRSRLGVQVADEQVREAYAELYPSIDGSASYQRQFDAINPFAGSDAEDTFFGGGPTNDFLAINNDTLVDQLGLDYLQYLEDRQRAAEEAGLAFDPDENPFFIHNRVRLEVTATQLIYDGAAFSGLKAASRLKAAEKARFENQARQTVLNVATQYYRALLTREQAEILRRSEERARAEVEELRARVERGTRPKFDLLSTEVRLANVEAQRIRAENEADDAVDRLKLLLGVPQDQAIVPTDELIAPDAQFSPPASTEAAMAEAVEERPDLQAAALQVELNEIEREAATAGYLPIVEAFFTAAWVGQIPDDTNRVTQPDPLSSEVEVEERGPFDGAFWGPDVLAGVRLRWNFFNGFRTTARVAQNRLAVRQAELTLQELQNQVRIEVARSLRTLQSTWQQLQSQDRNVDNAELNYRHAALRVDEGVAGTVELRDANEQLDNSRLNYLQSIHDYRLAELQYDVAVGRPPHVELDELDAEVPEEE